MGNNKSKSYIEIKNERDIVTKKYLIQKKRRLSNYILSGAFLIVLIVITFYIIFRDTSITEIWRLLKTVRMPIVYVGIFAMLGFFLFQGMVIGLSAECQRIKLSLWEMMQYSFVSFFYSGVTPAAIGGQPMQLYHMCRDRISASKAILVLFVTNMAYQIVIVAMGLLMFLVKLKYILSISTTVVIFFFLGLSVNLLILLFLLGVMYSKDLLKKIFGGAVTLFCKIKLIKNEEKAQKDITNYLDEFESGIELIKTNRKRFFLIMLSTAAHFILYHMIPYFVFRAFGLSGPAALDFVAISAVLYVAINLFPLPGSVGAAEGGFVMLFGPLFGESIMPAMLLSRFINFYTMIIFSGIFAVYARLRKRYSLT